jgi:hypothetical protein
MTWARRSSRTWPGDRDSAERELRAPENPALDAMLAQAAAADPTLAWAQSFAPRLAAMRRRAWTLPAALVR